MKNSSPHPHAARTRKSSGFTLVELMVSIAVFLVVASAAFSLFSTHAPLFSRQQNISGLNITLRNAVTQLELDASNAGGGTYPSADYPAWPIGITINNNTGAGCFTASTKIYASTCFDTLNIIGIDPAVPPALISTAGSTDTNAINTINIAIPSAPEYTGSATNYAGLFKANDYLLFVKNNGSQFALVKLSAAGAASGTNVILKYYPTAITASTSDAWGITKYASLGADPYAAAFGTSFSGPPVADWVMKLAVTTYSVDATTTPSNPKLVRTAPDGTNTIVAEQIIGFKVGATLWVTGGVGSTDNFRFDNTGYTQYDPSQIRSILVSLIGRTNPNLAGDNNYKNTFDNGNYQIQAISVAINPRNLSMRDQ